MHSSQTDRRVGVGRMSVCVMAGFLLWAVCGAVGGVQAQSIEEKLANPTDYVPKAIAPVDQLVEVARKFKIPMAIEWVEKPATTQPVKALPSRKWSVKELIEQIAPEQRVEVDDGLVRIYSPTEAVHPFSFLNIRLKSYSVKDGDLFAAEDQLRWAIRFALEPEKYRNGYNGGYGHGANHVFEIPKFTISAYDVTIREVLNRIALAQGNALWVTTINSEDLQGYEPFWKRNRTDRQIPITSSWHFIPLSEIAELAKERVAIDVMVTGMLDQRMTTIPVMLEHGLTGDYGGTIGGSSSDGTSYQYAAGIEKTGNDFVTLSVHLKVGYGAEAEINFDEKLQVRKDRITEVQPDPRIRIRAYFERAEKP